MTAEPATPEAKGLPKAKVFISYSRRDMAFADRLEAALAARDFEPLIDRTEIYAFEEWWQRIEALIGSADTVVFVLSPDSVASEVARKEVAFAATLNKRFAPIVCRRVDDTAVPSELARLNFVFFDDEAKFEASADRLAEALATDIGWIRQHTEFGETARRWAAAKAPKGLLLRSPVLEQAERWIAGRPHGAPAPTETTQAFIRQSREDATRRRRTLIGSLAVALIGALVLAGYAEWQRRDAVEQRAVAQRNEAQAKEERDKATRNFKLAQQTADSLVEDIARGLRDVQGMSTESVRKILETARATFEQLATSAPDDPALQRSRGVMLNEFGDTYLSLGDLAQALELYREGLAIAERLAAADRSNAQAQRDLLVSYFKVGRALAAQGKLDDALAAYRESLAIAERLATADRNNTQWQRDVSVCQNEIGDVLSAQGKLDEALAAYRASLVVRERLAAADQGNMQWQRDLAISYSKVAGALMRQGKLDEALAAYRDGLAVRERLAAADRGNTRWQRDLSVSYNDIGNVLLAQGKLEEALDVYLKDLAIAVRLAASDRSNSEWQRDLSISHGKVGDVLMRQRKPAEALNSYRESLAIAERLAASDPSNSERQRDLAISHSRVAFAQLALDNVEDALIELRKGREILAALVATAPGNAQWKQELAAFDGQIALLEERGRAAGKN